MTDIRKEDCVCPHCNNGFKTNLYHSINVSLNSSLKTKLFKGEINGVTCPTCKKEIVVATPLLYHDMNNRLWLQVTWEDEEDWKQVEENYRNFLTKIITGHPIFARLGPKEEMYKRRLVFGYEQLAEKVVIFDSGLDDRVIEYLKFLYLGSLDPKEKPTVGALRILFQCIEGNKFMFVFLNSNSGPKYFTIDRKPYDEITEEQSAMETLSQCFRDAFYVNMNRLLGIS